MAIQIPGIHHVTAITARAAQNVDFYTRTLGMRLVKKTVNQDDVSAYHLFYADQVGHPGTDLTFFDWPTSPPARPGTGTIAPVGLRVSGVETLNWWVKRFDELGVAHGQVEEKQGRTKLSFTDSEGQRLELVDDLGKPGGEPWRDSPVPAARQIRGLNDVTITSTRPQSRLLTDVLGFRKAAEHHDDDGTVVLLETGVGGAGSQVWLLVPSEPRPGRAGAGGVHHVAFRTPDEAQQIGWRDRLLRAGLEVTPVIDRFYFKSIYFREPGGPLMEIATDGPGFTADEPAEELGKHLALPPFLEHRRKEIEAGLKPIAAATAR